MGNNAINERSRRNSKTKGWWSIQVRKNRKFIFYYYYLLALKVQLLLRVWIKPLKCTSNNVKTCICITYTGHKLISGFQIKDKASKSYLKQNKHLLCKMPWTILYWRLSSWNKFQDCRINCWSCWKR